MNTLMELYFELKRGFEKIQFDGKNVFKVKSHDKGLPLVAVTLSNELESIKFSLEDISHKTRERGWVLPVYPLSSPDTGTNVMRMVIREGFSSDMVQKLIHDVQWAVDEQTNKSQPIVSHASHAVC